MAEPSANTEQGADQQSALIDLFFPIHAAGTSVYRDEPITEEERNQQICVDAATHDLKVTISNLKDALAQGEKERTEMHVGPVTELKKYATMMKETYLASQDNPDKDNIVARLNEILEGLKNHTNQYPSYGAYVKKLVIGAELKDTLALAEAAENSARAKSNQATCERSNPFEVACLLAGYAMIVRLNKKLIKHLTSKDKSGSMTEEERKDAETCMLATVAEVQHFSNRLQAVKGELTAMMAERGQCKHPRPDSDAKWRSNYFPEKIIETYLDPVLQELDGVRNNALVLLTVLDEHFFSNRESSPYLRTQLLNGLISSSMVLRLKGDA